MTIGTTSPRPAGGLSDRIRAELEARIRSGDWKPGHPIPSEATLMAQYGCARMTVNKALAGMAADGLVLRRRRAGTVVAPPTAERAVLEIADFPEEAARLGLPYAHRLLDRAVLPAEGVLHLVTLHERDGAPWAIEDRRIHLATVPEAAAVDFTTVPPGTWLLRHVPWTEAEHRIGASNATPGLARRLAIATGDACLLLDRRTWRGSQLVTEVRLTYPADRHGFVGRFAPRAGGDGLNGGHFP